MRAEDYAEKLNKLDIEHPQALKRLRMALASGGEEGVLRWLDQRRQDTYAVDIIEHFGLTAGRVANIMKKLEERGYITRCRVRNQAGKFTDMEYKILECPLKKAAAERTETEDTAPAPEEPVPEKPIPNPPHPGNPVVDSPAMDSPLPESAGQIITESPKTDEINTDLSNPDPSKTDLSIPDALLESPHLPQNLKQYGRETFDSIVSLILEVLTSRCDTFTLSGRKIPAELVKERFRALTSHHIEYVFDCMKKSGSEIRNIKQYLLTSLFNAPATLESYYRAKVSRDLGY